MGEPPLQPTGSTDAGTIVPGRTVSASLGLDSFDLRLSTLVFTNGMHSRRARRCSRTRWLRALLIALACLFPWLPGAARASPFIPRTSDGEGVKVGQRSTFHGGFALGFGVDSNVFLENRSEDPSAAAFVWPTAWLGLGNREVRDGLLMTPAERTGRIVDYSIIALAGFRQYLARREIVRSQPRFSAGSIIRLKFLPGRKFSIDFDEDFFRGADPGNYEALGNNFNFNRIDHAARLTFIGRPGGGRLGLAFGYRNDLLWFGPELPIARNNRLVNGLFHETKWRFLPKSSVLFQYTLDHTYYLSCCVEPSSGRNEDNFAHRLQAGYRGQAFKKFTFEVLAGWGLGYYRQDINGPNFNSFIGSASMNYFPTLTSLVHFSVYRRFQDSLFGNFYVDNGARLALGHQFRWRMLANLGLGVAGRSYQGLPDPGSETSDVTGYEGRGAADLQARDVLFTLDAKVEQPLARIFSLALSYNLVVDSTDFRVFYDNGSVDELGYVRHMLLFLAAVRI